MVKQFIVRLFNFNGTSAVRFINTNNIVSAQYIAEAIYGDKWNLISVEEKIFK